MDSKDYTKIKLRDFRHNLTKLKDSLSYGQMYEVTEKGKTIAYFIPSEYDVKVEKKTEESIEPLLNMINTISKSIPKKIIERLDKDGTYKKLYHGQLDKKHKQR